MPRAGVSAGRFDDGWDWIDPEREHDPAGAGEGQAAYYDWSQTGDFGARPRTRSLRVVPDPAPPQGTARPARRVRPVPAERRVPAERPVAAQRRVPAERPVAAQRPVRAERLERAVRAAGPVAAVEPLVEAASSTALPVSRTVTITGRGADAHLYTSSRRSATRSYERAGFQPDRIAMWAVLLGILMILAAATSAHAALLH